MGFAAVVHGVVAQDKLQQARIGFLLGRGHVEVVEGLIQFFDGPERPLHFAFGPRCDAATIFAPGQMRPHLHAEIAHDLLKHLAAGNRAAVHVHHIRHPLKGETVHGFGRHRGKHKPQRRLHVLAIDTVVLLVGHPTAVIHHAV